jgi:hypothetical protein
LSFLPVVRLKSLTLRRSLALATVTAAISGCSTANHPTAERPIGFALLANGALVTLVSDGSTHSFRVGDSHGNFAVGRWLATDGAGHLYVLAVRRRLTAVVRCDMKASRCNVVARFARGVIGRGIVIASGSGRAFIAANHKHGRGADAFLIDQPLRGGAASVIALRRSTAIDWSIFDVAIDKSGHYVAVSYHGVRSTGADVISLVRDMRLSCSQSGAGIGCLRWAHGEVAFNGRRVVATTGTPPNIAVESLHGRLLETFASQLPNNHLMTMLVDDSTQQVFALGSCGYVGGLSAVDLRTGGVRRLAPELNNPGAVIPRTAACGERMVGAGAGHFLVAQNPIPVPTHEPSHVLKMTRGGRVIQSWPTPASVLDLISARS